jgi:hypothetical protein
MFEEVKKRMASINFTLLLLVAAFAIYRGVDPCERLFVALTGVGVADIAIEDTGASDEGPPAPASLVVQLKDGQSVRILENGAVVVEGGQ